MVSAKFRNIMMTNSVIPDFIVDELYIFSPAAQNGPGQYAEEDVFGAAGPQSGRRRAEGSGRSCDPTDFADPAESAGLADPAGPAESVAAPVAASGVPFAGAEEEPDSFGAGCLWGTFRRVDAGAVVLDIATCDMVRFRYGCPVPEHLSRIRRATRDEIRDFFYNLGRAEQMLEK